MILKSSHTLVNPSTGHLAFKLFPVEGQNPFSEVQRLNVYSMIWIHAGSGTLHSDFNTYEIGADMLLSFSPYQPFYIESDQPLFATVIHFHPDFFCIHKHQEEVACNGVLFNNIYDPPLLEMDEPTATKFKIILEQMKDELQSEELAQYELLVSYLKIVLIAASRLKTQQFPDSTTPYDNDEAPFVLQNLKESIEEHYRTKHSASEYAEMLAITPKALAKLTKTHLNKTLTELINERIIIEAKRELYITNKPVKEIAFDLGYNDEYYFSRFFKKNAEVSPQVYRETVGQNRAAMA